MSEGIDLSTVALRVEEGFKAGLRVLAMGAAKLDGPGVYADPAGHPFCVFVAPGG